MRAQSGSGYELKDANFTSSIGAATNGPYRCVGTFRHSAPSTATNGGLSLMGDFVSILPAEVTTTPLTDVTQPGDPIVATSGNSPGNEGAERAIDNLLNTKYLNFDKLNAGFTVTPSVGRTLVQGLTLTSANDAPERDPASFTLEGSDDGINFTLIASNSVPPFPSRAFTQTFSFANNTPYAAYRLLFPTVANPAVAGSMQVVEVELLGMVANSPVITAQPQSQTVTQGQTATFTVEATGTAPLTYQWKRNDIDILGATGNVCSCGTNVRQEDNGSAFRVVVANAFGSVTSEVAILTVILDTFPPALVAAGTDCAGQVVTLTFNERLNSATAEESFNYTLDGGAMVNSATLLPDGRTVSLATDPLTGGTTYTVTVNDVTDLYGNAIAPNSAIAFISPVFAQGFALRQWWFNIPGNSLSALTGLPTYPGSPDAEDYTNLFELNSASQADNYGARLSAWFCPPVSGAYHFYLSADDQAGLYFSAVGDCANKLPIASEPLAASGRRDWTGTAGRNAAAPENRSSTLFPAGFSLVAGQRYCLEALVKEDAGGDHLAVAVQFPGDPPPANGSTPIPGQYLAVCLSSTGPVILACPQNITTNIVGSSVAVAYPNPTVASGTLVGCVPPSGSVFALGTTVVTCTATNASGSNTCTFNVTVQQLPASCLFFAGLEHCPAGSTTLTVQTNGLTVANLGTNGQDGVSIALGASDGWVGSFAPGLNLGATGVVFHCAAWGQVNGVPDQPVGTVQVTGQGGSFAAEYSFPGAAGAMIVSMYDTRGTVIFSVQMPPDERLIISGGNVNFISCVAGSGPTAIAIDEKGIKVAHPPTGTEEEAIMSCIGFDGGASVGGLNLPTVPGVVALVVSVEGTNNVPENFSSIALQATGLGSLTLDAELLRLFGVYHRAVGNATLAAQDSGGTNVLLVGNFCKSLEDNDCDDDSDDLAMLTGPASGIRVGLQVLFDPSSPVPSNTNFKVSSIVEPADGQHDDIFSVRFGYNGTSWGLTTASNGVPQPLALIEVWNNGVLVAGVSNPASVSVAGLPGVYWPNITWFVDDVICHRFLWDAPVVVEINGTSYAGKEVLVETKGGDEKTDHLSGVTLEGVNIVTVKVTGVDPAYPPYIYQQPQSATVCAGTPVTFTVLAKFENAGPFTHQWKKNSVAINGANSSTYTIQNPQPSDAGSYTLTVSDSVGMATSVPATLTVNECETIRGKVWSSLDFDCVQNTGELPLQGWGVQLNGGAFSAVTDSQGNYTFGVPAGNYTVSAVPPNANWVRVCPVAPSYTVTLNGGQTAVRHFAFRPPSGADCPDLWVDVQPVYPGPKFFHIRGPSTPCCGRDFIYNIRYGNNGGAVSAPAMLYFNYSQFTGGNVPLCTIGNVAATCGTVPHLSGGPGLEIFNLPALPPYSHCRIAVTMHLACDITTLCANQPPLFAQALIFQVPYRPECTNHLADNVSTKGVTPCCSSDPNDCTVSPKGCGPEGLIHREQALTYVVQFQNAGGGLASLVVVKDVLDADLDLNTLEFLGSSHDYFLQTNGRELWFVFPDIGLAPQALDEAASHGFVKFRIRPNANAPVGTMITNSAEIYFDYNDPITTLTTLNTITEDPVPVAAFTATPQPGSAGAVCDFVYTGGTVGAQLLWNFGPGAIPSTSTALNPTGVLFTTPGAHLVGLETRLGDCVAEASVQVVTVGRPTLNIARTDTEVSLSWAGAGFVVKETDSLSSPVQWQPLPAEAVALGGRNFLNIPFPGGSKFYRLVTMP